MAALGVDVELGGNVGVFESAEVDDDVFDVDGIVLGLEEKGGRGGGGGLEGGVEVGEGGRMR